MFLIADRTRCNGVGVEELSGSSGVGGGALEGRGGVVEQAAGTSGSASVSASSASSGMGGRGGLSGEVGSTSMPTGTSCDRMREVLADPVS